MTTDPDGTGKPKGTDVRPLEPGLPAWAVKLAALESSPEFQALVTARELDREMFTK